MPSQLKQQLATKLHNYGSSNTINLDPITYNSRYPGFDQANYRKLESKADNLGLTGYQREQFMDNLYQQVLPEVQKQIKNSDRRKYINDANYEISQIQDKDAQIQAKSKLAVTEISQKLKEKYNINPSTNDEQLFNDWIKSVPNGNQLFANYLNKGDTELLKKGGLGGDEVDNDSYAKIESKINGALKGDWGRLSTNGLKYVQGWKLILDATELAKAKGATGMNDGEIMRNVIKSSPKLQQKIAELQTIQKGLTDSDKSVLKGDTAGVTVGKSGFSILPGISLQLGDDAGMNISLVNDKPASYKDIQDLIDVKEKFGDNYVGEVGNVAKVFANQPIDTLKKKGNQILNEFDNIGTNMENFWNNIMPKQVVEAMQGKEMTDDELEQYKQNVAAEYDARKNKNKEQVLKYNDKINKAFQKQVEQNLDPQIKEYYDDKTITELLALGDMKGVGYKQAQMMASNWDMLPNIVVTAVSTPAGLTMMFGDSYARESQDSFERLMNAGADYDQASGISKVVGVINGAVEVGLDRLLGGVETTASKNLKNAFMNNLTEEATKKGIWEILGNIAKKQAGSSLEEGAEEVIQEIVSNAAEMTIKDNPEFADLFKGTWEAFEGGVFNPMNLMAGGTDIAANKGNIQQSLLDASYDAGVTARNIVDAGENMQNNLREFMLDGAYNAGKGARTIVDWADKVKEFMNRKKGQSVTTENVESENIGTENIGTESTAITPQGTETTVDETVAETNNKGDKATLKEELYSIDPTLKKNLQNNPYTAEVWQRTQDYIDKNGRPERSNDVAKALIVDVADKVQEKLVEKMKEGGKNGRLYQTIDDAGFTVDLTELKDGLDEILEGYGIKIEEYEGNDGETKTVLNFDKTAIDGSEANNIRKIYNWLKDTNAPMSEKEFRTRFKQAMKDMVDFNPVGRDQTGRKKADTPGDKVIKGIMKKANDLAHAQIPELAELDKIYSEWTDIMDEVSDGLVYKDAAKRGVIKDNVYQIIKNLDEPSRRQMVNRLEKLIPGIKDEVNAINQMPKVIDHIYKPSKLQQGLTSEGVKTVGAIGGLPGYLLAKWGGEGIAKLIDSQKNKAWNEVLQETSEEGKAKMAEIQAKIEANQKLSQEQEARLQGLKDRLLEKMATVDKTDAEQSAWNDWLADLEQDEVIDMPEEVYDQWEEVTTTPKKKTTKPTTPKQETKTEDNSDLREKIGDRFYNYLKEHADNVNRSRKTLAPVTIEELLTSGPYHGSTKFIDIYERDIRNKLDNIMYQIGKLDLPEVKLTKEQQEQLYELSALNMDRDMLRIKLMKEWIDKNPSKAGEKLTELTNEGADMVEQLEKAKAYVAEIEKAQENKEAKTKETVKPKKKTSKKTTKADAQSVKLDTKKIASDYMKGEMDWNKYQHLAGLTEEQALEKRGKFQAAIDEEWDKNQDYYNTHQSELVDKFHHLLK